VNKAETQSQTLQLPPTNPDIRRFSASSSLAGYGVLDLAGADAGDAEPSADDLRNDSSSVIRFAITIMRTRNHARNIRNITRRMTRLQILSGMVPVLRMSPEQNSILSPCDVC